MTKEHVLPNWLQRHPVGALHRQTRPATNTLHGLGDDGLPISEPRATYRSTLDITVKVVCQPCNNGWSSALEKRVQPLLEAMIAGGSGLVLQPDDVKALRRWAIKTAIVFDQNDRRRRVFTRKAREAIYNDTTPPGSWYVAALRVAPGAAAQFNLRDRSSRAVDAFTGVTQGYISGTMFSIGDAAFLVRYCSLPRVEVHVPPGAGPQPLELAPDCSEQIRWDAAPWVGDESWEELITPPNGFL